MRNKILTLAKPGRQRSWLLAASAICFATLPLLSDDPATKNRPVRETKPRVCLATDPASGCAAVPAYNTHNLAYYLTPEQVTFVRPGLVMTITGASISANGTISTTFTLTDLLGLPLDINGVYTPGPISVSFVAATIPEGQTQYTAYTTSTSTGTAGTFQIPASDKGGTYTTVTQGTYVYTFSTAAPSGYDQNATHTIAAWATRDLTTTFDLGKQYSNATFNWVPSGAPVTTIRDVVETQTCNQCHDPLNFHGGARQEVRVCITCHQPQLISSDSGAPDADFKVMIHKIHMGSSLPSVEAGGSYVVGGKDYSGVVFPSDVRNCTICHTPSASQANAYLVPTRATCGSCHDDVNFATGQGHSSRNLIQTSDAKCGQCHIPQGTKEFDNSVIGSHTIPTNSTQLHGVAFQLLSATGGPGQSPTVQFNVFDKNGNALPLSQLNSLSLLVAGPNSDYPGYTSESVLKTAQGTTNPYTYTFNYKLPPNATGSYTVGIEGYSTETITINQGATSSVRDSGHNQDLAFSVDGSPVAARREVVLQSNCNACHTSLSAHGGFRNDVTHCVLCHNPNGDDSDDRPTSANPPETIDFRTLIHKIHTGTNLTNPYVVYGHNASVNNFNLVQYPGDTRDCEKCHAAGTEELPLNSNLLSVVTPHGYLNPTLPTTAACVSCHDDQPTSSHALANTTTLGESCVVCHGTGASFSVDQVHAR
jgi:OmcA/MtrC family decaheme c-type cytochrome